MPRNRARPQALGNPRDTLGRTYDEVANPTMTPGAGITAGSGTIYKTSVVREGEVIVTRILLDLTGLASTTTDLDIIGTTGVSHIGQITAAVNGTILGGTMECLEVPATGADDIDFYSASVGTGAYDADASGLTSAAVLVTKSGAWALGDVNALVADAIVANDYLYLAAGEGSVPATYTAGRFLITLYGNPV